MVTLFYVDLIHGVDSHCDIFRKDSRFERDRLRDTVDRIYRESNEIRIKSVCIDSQNLFEVTLIRMTCLAGDTFAARQHRIYHNSIAFNEKRIGRIIYFAYKSRRLPSRNKRIISVGRIVTDKVSVRHSRHFYLYLHNSRRIHRSAGRSEKFQCFRSYQFPCFHIFTFI